MWLRWARNEDCHRAQTACQTMTSPPREDEEVGETGTKEASTSVAPQFTELMPSLGVMRGNERFIGSSTD